MKVYLDNAATTPMRSEVINAMTPYLRDNFGNPSSVHSWGQNAREAVESARQRIAMILHCNPSEIYYTGTDTTSTNLAIQGVIRESRVENPHIITTAIEHHAVLEICQKLSASGACDISVLKVDEHGLINPEDLTTLVTPRTVLVSVMFANNEVGTIEPIAEIGAMLAKINEKREANGQPRINFHVDGAPVAEYVYLDLEKLNVDLFSLGAHKFHGPKGVGLLYVKTGVYVKPILYGGHHEKGLWPGTENVAGIVGMAKALEIAQSSIESRNEHVTYLRDRLISGLLRQIPKAKLTGHPELRLPDIASFTFEGAEGEAVLLLLDKAGIAASSGSACTSGDLHHSHVLLAMGIPAPIAHSSIRFSLSDETTAEEIDYVIDTLPGIVKQLRAMSPYGNDVSQKIV